MKRLSAFCAGVLFGAGLLLSGMANPANVLAFLDVAGDWNPALALTMGGAIAVAAPAFHYHRRSALAVANGCTTIISRAGIDRRLLGGAGIFGIGWGLSGICPGPGLVLLTTLSPGSLVFVASMIAGMFLAKRTVRDAPTEAVKTDLSPVSD
jgi:uncharacterized membrane protein YedE/YeeE